MATELWQRCTQNKTTSKRKRTQSKPIKIQATKLKLHERDATARGKHVYKSLLLYMHNSILHIHIACIEWIRTYNTILYIYKIETNFVCNSQNVCLDSFFLSFVVCLLYDTYYLLKTQLLSHSTLLCSSVLQFTKQYKQLTRKTSFFLRLHCIAFRCDASHFILIIVVLFW